MAVLPDEQFTVDHFHAATKSQGAGLSRSHVHHDRLPRGKILLDAKIGKDNLAGAVLCIGPEERQFQRLASFRWNIRGFETGAADVYQYGSGGNLRPPADRIRARSHAIDERHPDYLVPP